MYRYSRKLFISLVLVLLGVVTQQAAVRMPVFAIPAAASAMTRASDKATAATPPVIRKVTAKRVYSVQGTRQVAARLLLAPQEGVAGQVAFQVSISSTLPISPLLTPITVQRDNEQLRVPLTQPTGQLALSNRVVQWQRATAPGRIDLTVTIQATAAPATTDEIWWLRVGNLSPDPTTITTLAMTSATGTITQVEVEPQVVVEPLIYSVSHPLPDQVILRGYGARIVEPSAGVAPGCESVALHWQAAAGANPAIPPITTSTTTEPYGLGLVCAAQGKVSLTNVKTSGRYTYTLQAAAGEFVNQAQAVLIVTLPPTPTIEFMAQPAEFERGAVETITLTWRTTNADRVTIAPGVGTVGLSGTISVPAPVEAITYTLAAAGPGGATTSYARVYVRDTTPPTVTIAHEPATPTSNDSITFTAKATDSQGGIARIEIWVNDLLVHSCVQETSCTAVPSRYGVGELRYKAVAVDQAENRAETPVQTLQISAVIATPGQAAKMVLAPPFIGIPVFDQVRQGVEEAAAELQNPAPLIFREPTPANSAADQIDIVTTAVSQTIDAIMLGNNAGDQIAPAAQAAHDAGVAIVTWHNPIPSSAGEDLFITQVDFDETGRVMAAMARHILGEDGGKFAILSSAPDAADQNRWIAALQTVLQETQYANLELLTIVYGNDQAEGSYHQALALVDKYPEMELIMAPTSIGLVAAAKALHDEDLCDQVKVSGLGLPGEMLTYTQQGCAPEFALWDFGNLGYLTYYTAYLLATDQMTAEEGVTFEAGRLGAYTIEKDPTRPNGLRIVLGPFTLYNKDNIEQSAIYSHRNRISGAFTFRGSPVADIPVTLLTEANCDISKVVQRTVTNNQGAYHFLGVTPGPYSIAINGWNLSGIPVQPYEQTCSSLLTKTVDALIFNEALHKTDLQITFPSGLEPISSLTPEFQWQPYPDATRYQIYLSKAAGRFGRFYPFYPSPVYSFFQTVNGEFTDNTSFTSYWPLAEGNNYQLTVWAWDTTEQIAVGTVNFSTQSLTPYQQCLDGCNGNSTCEALCRFCLTRPDLCAPDFPFLVP